MPTLRKLPDVRLRLRCICRLAFSLNQRGPLGAVLYSFEVPDYGASFCVVATDDCVTWTATETVVKWLLRDCKGERSKEEVTAWVCSMPFQMAEVAVPRELFVAILERSQRFGVPPPLVQRG